MTKQHITIEDLRQAKVALDAAVRRCGVCEQSFPDPVPCYLIEGMFWLICDSCLEKLVGPEAFQQRAKL